MRSALIMEGGAMRGMFTCGVIDVFMENGIHFDGAAGVSAGAAFGVNIKSGQIGRAIRYNKKYCKDKRMGSIWSWLKTGDLYDVDFAYRKLVYELDPFDVKAFEENPMEFWLCATDVETGKAVYHKCMDGGEKDLEWIRASASIPVLSKVVEIDGKKLLDGGTAVPVPYDFMMQDQKYDKSITILTQPRGFKKSRTKELPLIRFALRKYPRMVEAIANRHERYNALYDHIYEEEKRGSTLIIQPCESLGVGSAENDPEKLERVYQTGRKVALDRLEEVRNFLQG